MKTPYPWLAGLILLWSATAAAGGMRYELRVDGLSCPFCTYGIEKKLVNTRGVTGVEIDLDRGVVVVKTREGVTLTEAQLKKLVDDAGFTLRGVKVSLETQQQ
ncbi:MAG TPA: copper chaperone [Gammaproteobacteria bacterium]|nr:copper chaperone [Gammaproteobacteria bacterium]